MSVNKTDSVADRIGGRSSVHENLWVDHPKTTPCPGYGDKLSRCCSPSQGLSPRQPQKKAQFRLGTLFMFLRLKPMLARSGCELASNNRERSWGRHRHFHPEAIPANRLDEPQVIQMRNKNTILHRLTRNGQHPKDTRHLCSFQLRVARALHFLARLSKLRCR